MARANESVQEVEAWFRQELGKLWPAALGSVSLRRSPCTRPTCQACATGEQHPSYVLYGREDGHRFSVYLPDELAPKVEEAIARGRQIQDLLQEAGRRYALALKRERIQPG